MITANNLKEVVNALSNEDKQLIQEADLREYIQIGLSCCNSGSVSRVVYIDAEYYVKALNIFGKDFYKFREVLQDNNLTAKQVYYIIITLD